MNTHEHASAAKPPSTMAPHAPFQAKLHPPSTSFSEHMPPAKTPGSRQHRPLKHHQPTKNVTFAPQSKGRIIPSLDEHTDRQKRRLWQTPEDKKANQVEVAHIVRTVRRRRKNFSAMSLSSTGNQPDDRRQHVGRNRSTATTKTFLLGARMLHYWAPGCYIPRRGASDGKHYLAPYL